MFSLDVGFGEWYQCACCCNCEYRHVDHTSCDMRLSRLIERSTIAFHCSFEIFVSLEWYWFSLDVDIVFSVVFIISGGGRLVSLG